MKTNKTIELVGYGHPDRFADYIGELVLERNLAQDKDAKVALEVLATRDSISLGGEITSKANIDYEELIYEAIEKVYGEKWWPNYRDVKVNNFIAKQSPELSKNQEKSIVAGDQGVVYGYYNEYRFETIESLYELMNDIKDKFDIAPDWKLLYNKNELSMSVCGNVDHADIKTFILKNRMKYIPICMIDKIIVNPKGPWLIPGPLADTGVVGRKLMIDTFGAGIPHGGGAFCLDKDTQYLTRTGWKNLDDYRGGEIAQWNNGELEWVQPTKYHVEDAEKMYHFKGNNNVDMVLSENHDIVNITSKGNIRKDKVKDIIDNIEKIRNIPVSFINKQDRSNLDLSDNEIRLQIAFNADGRLSESKTAKSSIQIKKEYKKQWLKELLEACNIEYSRSDYDDGYSVFRFIPPLHTKNFGEDWWSANQTQLQIIANEVVKWDGDRDKVFRTTIEADADFVQWVFMNTENYGVKSFRNHKSGGYFEVTKSKRLTVGFRTKPERQSKVSVEEFKPIDGKMYCFTVPSGMFIVRRNNNIFVTGNCGKDPSKVDKTGIIIASYLAKDAAKFTGHNEVLVELNYKIGDELPRAYAHYPNGETQDISGAVNLTLDEYIKTYKLLDEPWSEYVIKGGVISYLSRKEKDE